MFGTSTSSSSIMRVLMFCLLMQVSHAIEPITFLVCYGSFGLIMLLVGIFVEIEHLIGDMLGGALILLGSTVLLISVWLGYMTLTDPDRKKAK
mmetsp:Transcript_132393/g.241065  ORF Transcript_132393/g.241065 Transcript_132393/m.241065 type:complete len:93 (-) Transcript_132393:98-376(-)